MFLRKHGIAKMVHSHILVSEDCGDTLLVQMNVDGRNNQEKWEKY